MALILTGLNLSTCTAINPLSIYYMNKGGSTNPAQEYSDTNVLNKGGFFYHQAYVAGPVGNARNLINAKSCSYSILWIVAFGNSGINHTRKQARIKKIALVEYEILGIGAFVYHQFCTVVYGE